MNEEKLLDAFGQIEEEFIEEADPDIQRKTVSCKKRSGHWTRWAIYAACAVVVVGAAAPLMKEVSLSSGTQNAEKAEMGDGAGVPEGIQDIGEQESIGSLEDGPAEGKEETEGSKNYWTALYNEATAYMDSARAYLPGYFTEQLSEEKLGAIKPNVGYEWMQYTGQAGFDGEGTIVDVSLWVTTTIPEESIGISISKDGSGRCFILDEDAVKSVCYGVEYTLSQWFHEERVILAADAVINDYSYAFTLTTSAQNVEQAKEDFALVLECFTNYTEGKPNFSAITAEVIPEWFDKKLSYQEAITEATYGAYMLLEMPKGFTAESIRRFKNQNSDYLSGLWTKGYDELSWTVYTISEADESRITEIDETENYDLTLYPIPRASSVPDELREIVNNPIFIGEELTKEAVFARAYKVEDAGDSNGWRMNFSVKYGDTVVEIRAKGVDPEWIYQQLLALNRN